MRTLTIALPPDVHQRLAQLAKQRHTSKAALVREAVASLSAAALPSSI